MKCSWKKSCTSWEYREYPSFHGISYITSDARLLPSTVSLSFLDLSLEFARIPQKSVVSMGEITLIWHGWPCWDDLQGQKKHVLYRSWGLVSGSPLPASTFQGEVGGVGREGQTESSENWQKVKNDKRHVRAWFTWRQDLCLDSWWTRPGCRVNKNHWTKLDTSEFLRDTVEKFTSNHFHSIPLDSCCVINEAILAMSSAMPSSRVLMESQRCQVCYGHWTDMPWKAQIPKAICGCAKHPTTLGYLGNIAVMCMIG